MIILLLGLALASVQAAPIKLKGAQFDPLTGPVTRTGLPSEKLSKSKPAGAVLKAGESRLALVQWTDAMSKERVAAFKAAGGRLISPVSPKTYLALLPAAMDLGSVAQNKAFAKAAAPAWAGEMAPEWKLDPKLTASLAGMVQVAPSAATLASYNVQIVYTGGEQATRDALKALGAGAKLQAVWPDFETWQIQAQPAAIEALARLNGVMWIEPYIEPKATGERAGLAIANIVNSTGNDVGAPGAYAAWLSKVGLSGKGVTVQVIDTGFCQGLATNQPGSAHPDFLGQIAGLDNDTYDPLGFDIDGHGTINASIIMGSPKAINPKTGLPYTDPTGYLMGQGVAPGAKVYPSKVSDPSGAFTFPERTPDSVVQTAYMAGARISSNSWGASTGGQYTTPDQLFDRLTRDATLFNGRQPMTFVFAAGNDGATGIRSVGSPGVAKNVITVGAGESSDKGEVDHSLVGPADADDLRDVTYFSSRGPTQDGRFSPTVFAPGTHVAGAASDDPAFNGSGITGRLMVQPGEDISAFKYYPAFQSFYTRCSGTSQATPTVAGTVALLYEYCVKAFGKTPSPALAKAMLVAGAVDCVGGNRNFIRTNSSDKLLPIPNNDQGWGRCSLAGIVDKPGAAFFVVDQATTMTFDGDTRTYQVWVTDSTKPLKVVLNWTDPPASLAAAAQLVNDLDLTVSNVTGGTWHGNNFANGYTVQGSYADRVNNMECVFIKNPAPGLYTITIQAFSLNGDAFLSGTGNVQQDFALFATNVQTAPPATPTVALSKPFYTTGDAPVVTVIDGARKGLGTAKATLSNSVHTDTETLTLTETPAGSGYFLGTMPLATWGTPVPGDGTITATHYTYLVASYTDTLKVAHTTKSLIDVGAAKLTSTVVTDISSDYAVIQVVTSEATNVTLNYGPFPTQLQNTAASMSMSTMHTFKLSPLTENMPYFYTVTMVDQAGNTSTDDNSGITYTFQTLLEHNDFYDNFDAGPLPGWVHYSNLGIDDWVWYQDAYDGDNAYTTVQNGAFVSKDIATAKDVSLVSPPVRIKAKARLSFNQWYNFQAKGRPYGFDGAVVEITTDNGTSWQDLGGRIIDNSSAVPGAANTQVSSYDTILSTGSDNPLGGRMSWSGRSWDKFHPVIIKSNLNDTSASTRRHDYAYPVTVDLSDFVGQEVKLRWRLGTNNSVGADRWIVDDVRVWSPAPSLNSMARVKFDQAKFNGGQTQIRFTLSDAGLSAASGTQPSPSDFLLANPTFPQGITLFRITGLKMIDPAGQWEGYLTIAPNPGIAKAVFVNGLLNLKEGEWLKLIYTDSDIGDGTAFDVSDTTILDWTAPKLLSNTVSQVRNFDFTVALTADEPVSATIKIGPSMSNLNQSYTVNSFGTALSVKALGLTPDTPYYYTILLKDVAGNTTYNDNSGFGYGVRTNVNHLYKDTLEPTPAFQWSQTVAQGSNVWTMVTGRVNQSASNSWYGETSTSRNDCTLMLTGIAAGDNGIEIHDGYTLRFWHAYQFQPGRDGGVLEISRDGGTTWEDLGPNIIGGTPYSYVISWAFGNALGGRSAWSGDTMARGMQQVTVDLSPYAGVGRLIRWRLACDSDTRTPTGWFIDDVELDAYGPALLDFPSKPSLVAPLNNKTAIPYDVDMNLKWATTPRSNKYRVLVGTDPAKMTQLVETGATQYPVSESSLKAGTTYYWRVVAIYDLENPKNPLITPSDVFTFKTQIVDPLRFANQMIGKTPALTTPEMTKGDYNGDGKIDITDLVTNIKHR